MHYDPTDDVDTHKLGSGVHSPPPSLHNSSLHTTSSTPTTPTPHTIHTTHNIHNKNNTIPFLDIPLYINAEVHIENVMFIGHHFYPQVSKKTLVTYNVTLSNVRGTGLSVFKAHGPKKAPREMMVSICIRVFMCIYVYGIGTYMYMLYVYIRVYLVYEYCISHTTAIYTHALIQIYTNTTLHVILCLLYIHTCI